MKRKLSLTLLSFLAFISLTFAQRMVTKTNILFGPFYKSARTIQEVKTGPRTTTQTTIKVRPSSPFTLTHFGSIYVFGERCNGIIFPRLGGGGNISEFRIYSKKKGAMHGFYFGPYTSISFISLTSAEIPVNFSDPKSGISYSATLTETYKLYLAGGGFQIGVQSMKKRFCVDWTILAIGFGKAGIKGTIEATNTSDNFDFHAILSDNPENIQFGVEKNLNFTKTVWATELSFDKHIPCPMIRMGLSIGFGYMMAPKIGKGKKDEGGNAEPPANQQPTPQTQQQNPQPTQQQIPQQAQQQVPHQTPQQTQQQPQQTQQSDPKSNTQTYQSDRKIERLKRKAARAERKAKAEEEKQQKESEHN